MPHIARLDGPLPLPPPGVGSREMDSNYGRGNWNRQHSTLNTQHSTLNTQHSTFDIQHSIFELGRQGIDLNYFVCLRHVTVIREHAVWSRRSHNLNLCA